MPKALISLTCVAWLMSSAFADDLYGPPWERFTPDTCFHEWTFGYDQDSMCEPDPGGFGSHAAFADWEGTGSWLPAYDGRTGVFVGGEVCYVVLQPPLPGEILYTDFYIQVVSHGDAPVLTVELSDYLPTSADVELTHELNFAGTDWWYRRYHMYVHQPPVPIGPRVWFISDFEHGVLIDQIVVDSIPEPAVLCLFAVGTLLIRRR